MRKINVLSLCDGIATARYALEQAGFEIENYYASEIDKYAITVALKNYPDIKEVGNVKDIKGSDFKNIDLVIFGSPCQSLSITTSKKRQNLDGKSKLFFECYRVLQEVKPKYFLMENIASMKDECKQIISDYMGVEPIYINSNCFSAQDRPRYYWTNIPVDISNLKESDVMLKDIIQNESEIDEKFYYKQTYEYLGDKKVCAILNIKGHDLIKRVHSPNFKCSTLTTCGGGNTQKKVLINNRVRKLTPTEYERLQTLPDNYTEGIAMTNRYNCLGNGFTSKVIEFIVKGMNFND